MYAINSKLNDILLEHGDNSCQEAFINVSMSTFLSYGNKWFVGRCLNFDCVQLTNLSFIYLFICLFVAWIIITSEQTK